MKSVSLLLTTCLVLLLFPKSVSAAISVNIQNVPSSINTDQEFTLDVVLTCSGCGTSYLRGVFFYPDSSSSYSGFTQNNTGDWINSSGSPSGYFKIESGSWSGQMKFRFDPTKTTGDYYFKVGRYTASGTSFSQVSETVAVSVLAISPTPTETITISDTPTPTQTPSPTTSKSIYKIYKPKDGNGQLITSVKIYVDNQYTHHEDDEILEFCEVCFCDSTKTIPCGFGDHTIKLTKTGYSEWSEFRNINQGTVYETTPILSKLPDATPTPTETKTMTQTPVKTPIQTPALTKTPLITPTIVSATSSATVSAVLGESTSSASVSAVFVFPSPTSQKKTNKQTNYKIPFFIGIFLSVSSGALLYFRHRKD